MAKGNPYHVQSGEFGGQFTSALRKGAGLPPEDLQYFNTYMQRWVSGIDADSRDTAFGLAMGNKELHEYLLEEAFGKSYPMETTLYRVGGLGDIEEGRVVSLFIDRGTAESYQVRMGVDSISEYRVFTKAIVPTLSGSGEVWVEIDELL